MTKESKRREGKPPLEKISPSFIESMAKIQAMGDRKHGEPGTPGHWMVNDYKSSDIIGAIKRHIGAIEKGEYTDDESGEFHGAHAALGLMYLFHFFENNMDDRFDGQYQKRKPTQSKRRVPTHPQQTVGDRPTNEGTERS